MTQENGLTTEVVKIKLNTALTKAGISLQQLHSIESAIVYNSDGLPGMQNLCSLIKKAKKATDDAHKIAKAPAKAECDACDEAKRSIYAALDEIQNRVEPKMRAINDEEQAKKKAEEEERRKKAEIRVSIAQFLQEYSQQIAQCNTFNSLRSVENRVNLEKANKSKYGDLYDEAKSAFIQLTNGISAQKEVIKQKTELEKKLQDAIATKNDEAAIEIQAQKELLDAEIDDNKVRIQETAVNIVINQKADEVEQEYTTIEAKRRYWKWDVVDINETAKKMITWTQVVPNDVNIDEFLKASKESWNKEKKDEVIVHGIKFYIDKKYV